MRLSIILVAVAIGVGVYFVINDNTQASTDSEDMTDTTTDDMTDTTGDNSSQGQLITLAWGSRVSADFRSSVVQVAGSLGIDPSWLMAVIAEETAYTFSTSVQNPTTQATGLIQFLPSTAEALGTTISDLSDMDPTSQLQYVQQYLQPYAGQMNSVVDVFMAVFYPSAIGKSSNTILFSQGSAAYNANASIDKTGLGFITIAMAAARATAALATGLVPPNVYVGTIEMVT
jgi:Transglycosylase SLT domain